MRIARRSFLRVLAGVASVVFGGSQLAGCLGYSSGKQSSSESPVSPAGSSTTTTPATQITDNASSQARPSSAPVWDSSATIDFVEGVPAVISVREFVTGSRPGSRRDHAEVGEADTRHHLESKQRLAFLRRQTARCQARGAHDPDGFQLHGRRPEAMIATAIRVRPPHQTPSSRTTSSNDSRPRITSTAPFAIATAAGRGFEKFIWFGMKYAPASITARTSPT